MQENSISQQNQSPVQNPVIQNDPNVQISPEVKPAGGKIRFVANYIDGIILGIFINIIILVLALGFNYSTFDPSDLLKTLRVNFLFFAMSFILPLIYQTLFLWKKGATLGKSFAGIKVLTYGSYQPLSFKKALIRELVKLLVIWIIVALISFIGGILLGFLIFTSLALILSKTISPILVIFLVFTGLVIFLVIDFLIYYKLFISLKTGKRGLQDLVAGTQVIVIKPVGGRKKTLLLLTIVGILLMSTLNAAFIFRRNVAESSVQKSDILQDISNMKTSRDEARDQRRKSDISALSKALMLYTDSFGRYPVSLDDLSGDFIKPFPTDPTFGTAYIYSSNEDGSSVSVYAPLEFPKSGEAPSAAWCWQSRTGVEKEMTASECIP